MVITYLNWKTIWVNLHSSSYQHWKSSIKNSTVIIFHYFAKCRQQFVLDWMDSQKQLANVKGRLGAWPKGKEMKKASILDNILSQSRWHLTVEGIHLNATRVQNGLRRALCKLRFTVLHYWQHYWQDMRLTLFHVHLYNYNNNEEAFSSYCAASD